MAKIKERGNDSFNILVLHPNNFKLLVGRDYIKEIGNTTLLFDDYTGLWNLVNSNYHCVSSPDHSRLGKNWYLFRTKKTIFGNRKATPKPAVNVIELATDQILSVIQTLEKEDWSFFELYNYLQPRLNLPEYRLPDNKKGDG